MTPKHPDAVAWDKWEETEAGKRCLKGDAAGEYLRNRLRTAFAAGIAHGRKCPDPERVRKAKKS